LTKPATAYDWRNQRSIVMDAQTPDFDLDIIGVLEGADKSSSISNSWDYLRHYQALLTPWRHADINVIEIGVARGISLNIWRHFFTRATIVGIDIQPECSRFTGGRVTVEIGSQEDPAFLHAVCAKYPPTIIIDDGSHYAHHIVYSFQHLFPMLIHGGVYIVEDMAVHFGASAEKMAGGTKVSAVEYFLGLARGKLAHGRTGAELWGDDRYIADHLDSIAFIGGAVLIRKKQPADRAASIAFAERHLAATDAPPGQHVRFADYIIRHGGPLDQAERAVRTAIRLGGPSLEASKTLIELLTRAGRLDEAVQTALEAAATWPKDAAAWERLANLEKQRGKIDAAITAMERAAALGPRILHYHDQLSRLLQQQGRLPEALAAARRASELNPELEGLRRRVADLARQTGG
jgi:hypothetical protein